LIRLEGISRTFLVGGRPVHALSDIQERIAPGEHVAIMGPSGSGKSTLLNILGCLDRPSSGHYHLDGREIGRLDEEKLTEVRRREIGFVFQFFHLVPRLTALENVELPMVFAGTPRAKKRKLATEALAAVGLGERADHRPSQLSGGEQQRVALARATVMGPRVLLADEPTGNLDTKTGGEILELLDRINREVGSTLVMVTHDAEAAGSCHRILSLKDGMLVSDRSR